MTTEEAFRCLLFELRKISNLSSHIYTARRSRSLESKAYAERQLYVKRQVAEVLVDYEIPKDSPTKHEELTAEIFRLKDELRTERRKRVRAQLELEIFKWERREGNDAE